MKGFCYTEKDRVVVNAEKEPDTTNFGNDAIKIEYYEWLDLCYVVDNAWLYKSKVPHWRVNFEKSFSSARIDSGQPVHFDITGEKKAKIIEIG